MQFDRGRRKENSEKKTEKEQLWKEHVQKETVLKKGRETTNQQSCHQDESLQGWAAG